MKAGVRMLAGIGRALLSLIFISMGVATLFNWDMAETEISMALSNWEIYASGNNQILTVTTIMGESIMICLIVAVVLQIVGGVSLFFGIQVRWGAFFLLCYLVPAAVLFNHFWFFEGEAMATSLVLFLKDVSIIGGLLIILAFGNGRALPRTAPKQSQGRRENADEDR